MCSQEEIHRVQEHLAFHISTIESYKSIEDAEHRKRLAESELCFMLFIVAQLLPEEIKEEIADAHVIYIALTPYQGK